MANIRGAQVSTQARVRRWGKYGVYAASQQDNIVEVANVRVHAASPQENVVEGANVREEVQNTSEVALTYAKPVMVVQGTVLALQMTLVPYLCHNCTGYCPCAAAVTGYLCHNCAGYCPCVAAVTGYLCNDCAGYCPCAAAVAGSLLVLLL